MKHGQQRRSVPDFYELELCKEYDSNGSSDRSEKTEDRIADLEQGLG